MWKRLYQDFLRHIFRILSMSAHLHAERDQGSMQQLQPMPYAIGISLAQQ
jgi:hypothetical protein